MMRLFFFLSLFLFFFTVTSISAETQEKGTLIVSYNTGEKAERLNRVRFSLISEDGTEQMYPKGESFVESTDHLSRIVAIENLSMGNYRLRFLIPNSDQLFSDVPEKKITIVDDKIVRIDQTFHPLYSTLKIKTNLLPEESSPVIWKGISEIKNFFPFVAESVMTRRPSGTVIINQINAQLTVNNSLSSARWTLLKNNTRVYEGLGSVVNYQIEEGDNYRIVPEEIEGYTTRISPSYSFSLYPAQTLNVSIVYERSFGTLAIQSPFPDGESITLTIKSRDTPPINFKIKSQAGKIFWLSKPLPTGTYEIFYHLPPNYPAVPPEKVVIKRGERFLLNPKLFTRGILHVIANVPEAIFVLMTPNGSKAWKGEGREYTFTDIPAGKYILSFSTLDPNYFIPPKEMKITLSETDNKEIKAVFQIAGKLIIKTNIDRSHALIQELSGKQKSYNDDIYNHSKVFYLPEGRYKIILSTLQEDKGTTANFSSPDPVEVSIKALNSEEINFSFRANQSKIEKQRRININTGIGASGFTIYKLSEGAKDAVGHFSGKNTQVTLPSADQYEVIFDQVPNYQTPDTLNIEIKEGEEKTFQAPYVPLLSFINIPEGKAIVGNALSEENINELPARLVYLNAFSIGVYEVTNAEYALWLNNAIKAGIISYVKEADNRGQVLNMKNQLLFKTFESDPYSQISAQLQSIDTPSFMPLAGKDSYPVINVSWYGAMQYCKDNNYRLPTEAEWEKSAGMEVESKGRPLRKFLYGFGQNKIDSTWANYKDNESRILYFQVLTTPVGFYNGVNYLPLNISRKNQEQTHLAKSPYGAFDMSGNVWEWVSDWYDDAYYTTMSDNNPQGPESGTQKVVKGGCYDSLAEGVRVTERMGLAPDYTDAYTGFRVAK